ncbi:MAG TPA: ABC transporter permease, partial [bacterium]|nr:ABC transporter permease [bacterium]
LSAVLLAGLAGGAAGLMAGYHRGAADTVVMRIADFQLALPLILLGIAWAAFIGTGVAAVVAVVALSSWVQYARVVRSMALSLRTSGFVEACTALGGTGGRVVVRHLLPIVLPTVAVLATLQLGRAVLLEATLSFLGLGLQRPTPAWGLMLSDGRNYLDSAWWVTLFPGAAISAFVLGANLFGDAIRDVFDPRLATGRRAGLNQEG